MNLFSHFRDIVLAELGELGLPAGLDLSRIAVEPPRDAAHGDIATNAAMVLAKPTGLQPRALADRLVERLRRQPDITAAEVAGPGFINMRLADGFWHARLAEILRAGPAYGDATIGGGRKVNVEFVSANPTGPMHVGHGRGLGLVDPCPLPRGARRRARREKLRRLPVSGRLPRSGGRGAQSAVRREP